jgi:hypothetical protein
MKAKILITIFSLALISFIPASKNPKFTRSDAIHWVMKSIINTEKTNLYCSKNLVTNEVFLIDNQKITNPYKSSWVFFIDDHPYSSWYHDCRIVFVSSKSRKFIISKAEIFPKKLSSLYEQLLKVFEPIPLVSNNVSYIQDQSMVLNKSNYAIIISSFDGTRNWFNTSLIYNVLIQTYHYQKNNIVVLYGWDGSSALYLNDLDGGSLSKDIDGPATIENIKRTINNFSGQENDSNIAPKLGHDDQLAVFFTGVPVTGEQPLMIFPVDENNYVLYPVSEISVPIEKIDCGQMSFLFDVNSSTTIAEYFKAANNTQVLCKNRYLTGPTLSGEKCLAEIYMTQGRYSEYLYYWASASRGYLPEVTKPWNRLDTIGIENGGGFLYRNFIPDHPGDSYLDDDHDSFLQMAEAFNYANNLDTWSDDGYCYLPYDGTEKETPFQVNEIPFAEDLITLAGLSGHIITPSQSLPAGSYIIADSLIIDPSKTLRFADNTEIYIHKNKIPAGKQNAQLIAKANSKLIIGKNNTIANLKEVSTTWPVSALVTYSDSIIIGSNTEFTNIRIGTSSTSPVKSLILKNIIMNNGMINTPNCGQLIIHKSNFTNTYLRCLNISAVMIDSNIFVKSHTHLRGSSLPSKLDLIANKYNGECSIYSSNGATVSIQNFQNFRITDNEILNTIYGINMDGCGWGALSNTVKGNVIDNITGITQQKFGIRLYFSNAVLQGNSISNMKGNGLEFYEHSMVSVEGNKKALTVNETQRIINNGGREVYTDSYSFPVFFKWNAIVDEDNIMTDDYLFYGDFISFEKKDISMNYWGRNFFPSYDLFPAESYKWEPVFNLRNSRSPGPDASETLFILAQTKLLQADYSGAQADFKKIISLYPKTRYASAGLKDLFIIETNTFRNFNRLKNYYETDATIAGNPSLAQVADFMSNRCDIELMNWQKAIDWFENRIKNPPSFNDSVYAIIDLGKIYIQMQDAGIELSQFQSTIPDLIPESDSAYLMKTDYLISLIQERTKKIE